MRFLLLNRFYGSQQTPTGRMLRDVALELQRRGHDVVAPASRGSYDGTHGGEKSGDSGIRVRYISEYGRSRILRWGSYWCHALVALASRKWDRCVILTDPPFLPFAAYLTKVFRRREQRVYWWTMDLYPEAMVAAGMISEGGMANRLLRQFNELGLRVVSGVVALGACQLRRLRSYRHFRSDPEFSRIVEPWDLRPLPAVPWESNRVLDALGCAHKKIALYTGNLGEGHPFAPFVDAARWLTAQGRDDWRFVFVIRGAGRLGLGQAVKGMPNFAVLDYFPEDLTSDLLWAATVHLISMKPEWEGIIVPSKLYGALQTQAKILYLGPSGSGTAHAIRDIGRGEVIEPDVANPEAVVRLLDFLASAECPSAGRNRDSGARSVADFLETQPKAMRSDPWDRSHWMH